MFVHHVFVAGRVKGLRQLANGKWAGAVAFMRTPPARPVGGQGVQVVAAGDDLGQGPDNGTCNGLATA